MTTLASDHPLAGVHAKFHRAREHFEKLNVELDDFYNQEPKPYYTRGEFDRDAWEWIERVYLREEPPLRLGVILGDVLHNLRSALDHLMTLLDRGTPNTSTQFPIASKSEEQFEAMADRMIPDLGAEHREFVKLHQPYHAGYEAGFAHGLGVFATLSNQDKHQVVHPTYGVLLTDPQELMEQIRQAYERSDSPGRPITGVQVANPGKRLTDGKGLIRLHWDRGMDPPSTVQVPAQFTSTVVFGEVGLDARDLSHIAGGIKGIIQHFQADFPETVFED